MWRVGHYSTERKPPSVVPVLSVHGVLREEVLSYPRESGRLRQWLRWICGHGATWSLNQLNS